MTAPVFTPGEGLSNYYSRLVAFSFVVSSIEQSKLVELRKRVAILSMQKLSFEKRKQYLEDNMPADETVSAWCADLTENLTGVVGTVEVPGESTHIQIQPGHGDNAVYDVARDGQLLPTVVATPAQAFYNLAMMPGWQKWKPLFRYGTITAIDGDTTSVTLENIKSSQQALEINQTSSLANVLIDYMDCNGTAFDVGDDVLIKFTGQAWEFPVIVGFKDNPKSCDFYIRIKCNGTTPTIPKTVRLWYTDGAGNAAIQTQSSSEAEPDLCGPFTGIYFPATIGLGNGGVPDGAPHPDQASKRLFHFWQEVDPVVYTSAKYLVSRSENSGMYVDGTMTQDLTNILYDAEPSASLTGNTVIISEISYKKLSTQLSEIPTGVIDFDGLKILQRRATINIRIHEDPSLCLCTFTNGLISTLPDSTETPESVFQSIVYADSDSVYDIDHLSIGTTFYVVGCPADHVAQAVGRSYYIGSALDAKSLVILTDENGDSPNHVPSSFNYYFDGLIQEADENGETYEGSCVVLFDKILTQTWIIEMIDTPVDRF